MAKIVKREAAERRTHAQSFAVLRIPSITTDKTIKTTRLSIFWKLLATTTTTTTGAAAAAASQQRWLAALLALLCFCANANNVTGRRHSPLLLDEPENGGRRSNRPAASECVFGRQVREIGSTWFADLGPPFGVMYCIKCQCVAVPKKRRILARTQCVNIKNECPPTNCDNPITLPGRCCKICPGDKDDTDIALDVPAPIEEEERSMKHFAALLTGRTSYFLRNEEMKSMYTTQSPQNIIATGRFLFQKKHLYYSFYIAPATMRPRSIQFVDDKGVILEENQLEGPLNAGPLSVYQNQTGKVCGVWHRVPRSYKALLRDGRLNVVLVWYRDQKTDFALGGRINKYTALQTEQFSALLEPKKPSTGVETSALAGAGGTAIVSTSCGAASSVHLTLIFNGIFGNDEYSDAPLSIRLELSERKELVLDESQRVRKPSTELNVVELSSPISMQNLRLMSRGKLLLTIESKRNPELRLQGYVVTRVACEIFQTVLAPPASSTISAAASSGLAWVYVNTDGTLAYNIETNHVYASDQPNISLVEDLGKRRSKLEDLTASFNFNQAVGVVGKLGPKVLESLYGGDLGLNIAIDGEPNLLRGRFSVRPVADARDSAEPILLKRDEQTLSGGLVAASHAAGIAWLAIDNECHLYYDVTISGIASSHNQTREELQVFLEEKPIEVYGAPVKLKSLGNFTGLSTEGFLQDMPARELAKLQNNVCYLEIRDRSAQVVLVRGKLKSTKVPKHCWPSYTDNNIQMPGDQFDQPEDNPVEPKCYDFDAVRFYNDSETWRHAKDVCRMCTCAMGKVNCETIKCPMLQCRAGEELIKQAGDCCSSCVPKSLVNLDGERSCMLGAHKHRAGATWHPYLPPNGQDECVTCTCDPLSLQVSCPKLKCPPLPCDESIAYRPTKKACCKVCPEAKAPPVRPERPINMNVLQDQPQPASPEESLNRPADGCTVNKNFYKNGQEFHPIITPEGEQKCIVCHCKNSKVICNRIFCPEDSCPRTARKRRNKVSDPLTDYCCCRRAGRHRRLKQNRKLRNGHTNGNGNRTNSNANANVNVNGGS